MNDAGRSRLRPGKPAGESEQPSLAALERRFAALLRQRCLEAATAAALQALGEAVPGVQAARRLVFGESALLAPAERRLSLAFEVIALYGLKLGAREQRAMRIVLDKLSAASVEAAERAAERVAARLARELGGPFAAQALPLLRVFSAAAAAVFANFAVARRAQALARLADPALDDLPSFLRGLSGVDEEKLIAWTREGLSRVLGPLRAGARGLRALARLAARMG
jgi:hypothetical protein